MTASTDNVVDYCRTLYSIWWRDGARNETFDGVLMAMFEELEELDGKEEMDKLRGESEKPPPPDLGISVQEKVGTKDKFGG